MTYQYYGYPPPANSFWATDPLDYPISYPEYTKPTEEEVQVADEVPVEFQWMPATPDTAAEYADTSVKAGHEGWDGSPLWVIRAMIEENCLIGKLAIKHGSAYVPHNGEEILVEEFEVLTMEPSTYRWLPASRGNLPLGAIIAGNTADGEPLYAGRARHRKSLTPGTVHPNRGCCVISFSGSQILYKHYEVLCKVI